MFKRLNRQERVLVERWLSPSAPSWGLTAVTEAARGGALWLCGAAGLALWPGRWRAGARDAAVAVAVASGFAHSIGHVLVRQRPAASRLPAYEAMTHKPTSASFPSAHAAVAAAFTTALTRRIGAAGLVTVPVAGVVAYSRVRMRAHWPSDVVVGIGQGVVVGEVVHRLMSGTVNFRQPASASCFAVFVDHVPAAAQAARTARVSCGVACSGHGLRNLAGMMTRRSLTVMSS